MLAAVLRSDVAVAASIQVVRTFVQLREFAVVHQELAAKLDALEVTYDEQYRAVFAAIRERRAPAFTTKAARIGF